MVKFLVLYEAVYYTGPINKTRAKGRIKSRRRLPLILARVTRGMEMGMTFGKKLKDIRKRAGMSQERLAERLGVSRQAVTKWETDAGTPELENITALSSLFHVSIDELLSRETDGNRPADYLYESVTEYDIDLPKHFDMKLGGADTLLLSGYEGEKILVRLASNSLTSLKSDIKVKIDDIKTRLDLDIIRKNEITEACAKKALMIFIKLPKRYISKIELSVNAENIELHSLECDSIELDTKTRNVTLDGVAGTVEFNCNLDMNIICNSLNGTVEINQLSAASKICVPEGTAFAAKVKGIGNRISYERDGGPADDFSIPDSDNIIELNGMKTELVICCSQKSRSEGHL